MICSEVEHQQAELMQRQKLDAVGSLASGIAHEFNNLLQTIRSYTIFAAESIDLQSQAHKDLQQVLRAAERATILTRQLLDFSRAEQVDAQPCLVDPLAQELANMLAPLLPSEIDLVVQLDSAAVPVLIDLQHMRQALLNLCLNARDAMPEGGTLTIRSEYVTCEGLDLELRECDQKANYVCVTVADTGTGIPSEVQPICSSPFIPRRKLAKGPAWAWR